jgi:hypothetical protein
MRLGKSLKLKFCETNDEGNALEITRKRLSRSPKKVVEMQGAVGVTHGALRNSKKGINCVIPDVRKHGRLANLCNQRVESV